MAENLLIEKKGAVEIITINRPNKLNSFNKQTIHELSDAIHNAIASMETSAIILTGAGDKSFVAGADIAELATFGQKEGHALSQQGHSSLFDVIENSGKPIIAAINGFALGGGLELAMACHLRIASENAKFGLPEVSIGVIPGYGGTQRLPHLVGKGKAMEMILTAEMIDAKEAHRINLVNQLVSSSELMNTCMKLAHKISSNSSVAISHAICAINAGFRENCDGFEVEIKQFGKCFATEDMKEGVHAFQEKRKPDFPGR